MEPQELEFHSTIRAKSPREMRELKESPMGDLNGVGNMDILKHENDNLREELKYLRETLIKVLDSKSQIKGTQ